MGEIVGLLYRLVASTTFGRLILVVVSTVVVYILVKRGFTNVQDKLLKGITKHVSYGKTHVDERITTVLRLLKHTISILVWVVGLLMVFDILGIDITPIVTGLGLAGFSLSLGMRDVVRDILSGLSFILTGTLLAGESVKIKDVEGTVELVGLRHVHIRDKDGKLHLIANRDINHIVKKIDEGVGETE